MEVGVPARSLDDLRAGGLSPCAWRLPASDAALLLSDSDPMVFIQRPVSAVMLGLAVAAIAVVLLPALHKKRDEAFAE